MLKTNCVSVSCGNKRIRVGKWLRRVSDVSVTVAEWLKHKGVYKAVDMKSAAVTKEAFMAQDDMNDKNSNVQNTHVKRKLPIVNSDSAKKKHLDTQDIALQQRQEPLLDDVGGYVQGTDVHVLPPLDCDSCPAPDVEIARAAGPSAAEARHTSLRAAEKRAVNKTQRGIGDVKFVQAMQKASASADAAASKGTEVFGQRSQWRLRESVKRRRASSANTDPQSATSSPVDSQTPSSVTPVHITALEPISRELAFADTHTCLDALPPPAALQLQHTAASRCRTGM